MAFPASSVTVPTLNPFEYSFNGLTFGGIAKTSGVPSEFYPLVQAPSGHDMPALRTGDVARPRDQGAFIGVNLLAARQIHVDLVVLPDATSLQHSLDTLMTALTPSGINAITEYPLFFNAPNRGTTATMARCTKMTFPLDSSRVAPSAAGPAGIIGGNAVDKGWVMAALEFTATDPRWYSTPTTATTLTPGTPVTVTNAGYMEVRPVFVLNGGPITNPSLANNTTGGSIGFARPGGGTTINSGDNITISMDTHAVTYFNHTSGVTSNIQNWIVASSEWWTLQPGANIVEYTTSAGSVTGTMQWASGYLVNA